MDLKVLEKLIHNGVKGDGQEARISILHSRRFRNSFGPTVR